MLNQEKAYNYILNKNLKPTCSTIQEVKVSVCNLLWESLSVKKFQVQRFDAGYVSKKNLNTYVHNVYIFSLSFSCQIVDLFSSFTKNKNHKKSYVLI